MKKNKIFKYFLSVLIFVFACGISASAQVWVFGSSGGGQNAFTAKGYAIKTESGKIQWLYSKFDNGGYDANGNMSMQDSGTTYTGTDNGVQYISAAKADGTTYQLYAFTNRNPSVYNYMFAYQKKSKNGDFTTVTDFTSRLGTPIRTSANLTEFPNGISQQWAIPINNFVFEPGTLYEFGFNQGMRANNGISLVLQDDGAGHYSGYLWSPFSTSEQALYDKMKNVEYQFISSFSQIAGTDYYNVNFVPMRFSVQTYADLTAWNTTAAQVQSFINGIAQSDYDSGKYSQTTIENLKAELDSMQSKAETTVKYQLETEADNSIAEMVNKITADMNTAKSEAEKYSDMTELDAELKIADDFYEVAKDNIGTDIGNYKKETVDDLKQTIDTAGTLTKKDRQSDIDKAVTELENAIINVKSSQIQTDKIILSDFVSGITVTLKTGSVPDDVSLIVTRVDAAEQGYKTLKASVGGSVKKIEIYEILLYSGDEKIQPSQPMTVQIPVPDSMKNNDISVYLAGDDLKAGKISSIRTETIVVTESGGTGYFSLVSFGKTITISKGSSQTAGSATVNSQTSDGSSLSVTEKASSGKVSVVKQTDESTKEKPDEKEKSLDITSGAGENTTSAVLTGKSRKQEQVANTVIPESEILQTSNPFWLLLCAAILGILGAVYGAALIIRKHRKNKPML
jgi:hypothetical protein